MGTPGLWNFLDHLYTLAVMVTPFFVWAFHKIQRVRREREEDRKKIAALWKEHGYEEWDGVERRKEERFSNVGASK